MYKLDKAGFDFIEGFEKFVAAPYKDSGGIWTQGIGSTINMDTGRRVQPGDPAITYETAKRWKLAHIEKYTNPIIMKLIKRPLSQNEYNAIASFVYNTGGYYFNSSGIAIPYNLFSRINNREPKNTLVPYWQRYAVTAGKNVLPGLLRRRQAEVQLYYS